MTDAQSSAITEPEFDDTEHGLMPIIRSLLEAPGDDAAAATQAVRQYLDYWNDVYVPGQYKIDEHRNDSVMDYVNAVTILVFDMASVVLFTSSEHERLARFLINIHESGPESYGIEDPGFNSFQTGLSLTLHHWKVFSIPWSEGDPDYKKTLDKEMSLSILLAKIFQKDILATKDAESSLLDMDAFLVLEKRTSPPSTDLGRWFGAKIAAQWILISGEVMAFHVKNHRPKAPLGKEKWVAWAAELKRLAETLPENAEWEVKQDVEKAHDKMVKLIPEWFVEDAKGESREHKEAEVKADEAKEGEAKEKEVKGSEVKQDEEQGAVEEQKKMEKESEAEGEVVEDEGIEERKEIDTKEAAMGEETKGQEGGLETSGEQRAAEEKGEVAVEEVKDEEMKDS
ncbi:hypothetical protein PT974_11930 [Cladobotryum mycophilum]|uniref:Uncharacterized protein n=1 Tax=Cladobotryum mycophilum TaxID=491253 RepID=A0ABR0S7L7_9HYPO